MEKEREKTHPTLSLLWATYTNNGSLEKFCESPPHLSSVGSECSGNSYWGCHFYWGHLFEGQTPWELRRTERGRETERRGWMQLLCRQVTLPEFSRQWGCICRFPKVSLASGLKKNEQEEQAHTHTLCCLMSTRWTPHILSPHRLIYSFIFHHRCPALFGLFIIALGACSELSVHKPETLWGSVVLLSLSCQSFWCYIKNKYVGAAFLTQWAFSGVYWRCRHHMCKYDVSNWAYC